MDKVNINLIGVTDHDNIPLHMCIEVKSGSFLLFPASIRNTCNDNKISRYSSQ
jgi:hypothetical protein